MFLSSLKSSPIFVGTVVLSLASGCGGGGAPEAKTSILKGKVMLDGQPIKGGTVRFSSDPPNPTMLDAGVKEDGTYQTSASGLQGTFHVSVQPPTPSSNPNEKRAKVDIPSKYQDPRTSQLTVTMKEGEQTFDIDMKK
jgi:hypothetical protein